MRKIKSIKISGPSAVLLPTLSQHVQLTVQIREALKKKLGIFPCKVLKANKKILSRKLKRRKENIIY